MANSLWRNGDFVRLWTGQTVSQLGSGIGGIGLELTAVTILGATAAEMGVLTALSMAPVILIGLPAGVWVDRLRRRPVMIVADLGRALLLLSVPLAWAFGLLSLLHLYIVAALVGLFTVFFDVADSAFLPRLLGRQDLVEGNSKLAVSSSVAEIGGPSLGGLLTGLVGGPLAVGLDAGSFLASAVAIGQIRTPEPPPTPRLEHRPLRQDIAEGLRLVAGHPLLRALTGTAATFSFFGNFIGALYTLYIIRELDLGPLILGISIGMGGIGALLGAVLVGPLTRRLGLGRALLASALFAPLLNLNLPLISGSPLVATLWLFAVQLIGDTAWSMYRINDISLRQSLVPDRLLGRANASNDFLVGGLGMVGSLLGGLLGATVGLRPTLMIAVLGLLVGALLLVFSPVRNVREVMIDD